MSESSQQPTLLEQKIIKEASAKDIAYAVLEKKGADVQHYSGEEIENLLRAFGVDAERIPTNVRESRKIKLWTVLWALAQEYGSKMRIKPTIIGEWLPAYRDKKPIPVRKYTKNLIAYTGGVGLFFATLALLDNAQNQKKKRWR